jgi:hypothetical protein
MLYQLSYAGNRLKANSNNAVELVALFKNEYTVPAFLSTLTLEQADGLLSYHSQQP